MQHYVFDNAAPQATQRFDSLATLYDPITVRHLESLGVGEGWRCLEVGGGGGSIAEWLARRVGPSGQVVVTDIDPRHLATLAALGHSNVEVQRHDVREDPLPAETFDLIHARLVLVHVATTEQALHKLVGALRPGGWLLIEDFDPHVVDPTFPTSDRAAAAVLQRMADVLLQLLVLRGAPLRWGRGLYQRLRAEVLVQVGMEGHLAIWTGGSPGARLMRANYEQIRAEALERGLITEHEIEAVLALLEDPGVAISSPIMFSAWGQRARL